MCAIAGFLSLVEAGGNDAAAVLARLNERQRRRGPDGEGRWISENQKVGLGHRRLAIIDTGPSGAQPMRDATGDWIISFNGEIYNYTELRQELERCGRKFLTHSDTEVLINTIAEWGEAGLRKLRGMYAFALWNDQQKELWLARDPFGIKPLYYANKGSMLWFASQARALAECAPVNVERRPAGLVGFYLWGAVPDPFTWWQGISALPAGHFLRIKSGSCVGNPKQFCAVEDFYKVASSEPISTYDLKQALLDSLAHHFVADVPVGIFLSGGIDSSVVASLTKEAGFRLHTVTLAFDEFKGRADDEAPDAEETARLLGADHKTVRVSKSEFLDFFDDFIASMDQPTTDGLNTYMVSRAAASIGLKVAISGLGADELFGGYPSFQQVPGLVSIGGKIPGRALTSRLLNGIGQPFAKIFNVSPKLAAALKYSKDVKSAYFLRRCLYLPDELEMLVDKSWVRAGLEELDEVFPSGSSGRHSKLMQHPEHAAVSQLEITGYMRMQPLRDTDWASMAHSLEVRVPFLDIPLLSKLAPAISSKKPPSKLDLARCGGPSLRRLEGRTKTGFATPVPQWLTHRAKSRGLRPWADRVASNFRHIPEVSEK